MTVIAGLCADGRVHMGGDSAGLAGWTLSLRADAKVFHLGPHVVVGFTDSFRMGDLIRYRMDDIKPPDDSERNQMHRWMVVEFIERLRAVLSEGGFRHKEHEVERGGEFLVAVRGQLFHVGGDFQVGMLRDGFHAVGCGADFARGSLATSSGDPVARVRTALEVAERMSGGVRGPFVIESTE